MVLQGACARQHSASDLHSTSGCRNAALARAPVPSQAGTSAAGLAQMALQHGQTLLPAMRPRHKHIIVACRAAEFCSAALIAFMQAASPTAAARSGACLADGEDYGQVCQGASALQVLQQSLRAAEHAVVLQAAPAASQPWQLAACNPGPKASTRWRILGRAGLQVLQHSLGQPTTPSHCSQAPAGVSL